jgi:hypothetical protein
MHRVCFRKHTCIEYPGIKEPATTTSDDQLVGASRPQVLDRLEAQVNQANNCDAEKTIYGGIYGGAYSSGEMELTQENHLAGGFITSVGFEQVSSALAMSSQ